MLRLVVSDAIEDAVIPDRDADFVLLVGGDVARRRSAETAVFGVRPG
jgi:uncharacterized LabA/DUF88 family protein